MLGLGVPSRVHTDGVEKYRFVKPQAPGKRQRPVTAASARSNASQRLTSRPVSAAQRQAVLGYGPSATSPRPPSADSRPRPSRPSTARPGGNVTAVAPAAPSPPPLPASSAKQWQAHPLYSPAAPYGGSGSGNSSNNIEFCAIQTGNSSRPGTAGLHRNNRPGSGVEPHSSVINSAELESFRAKLLAMESEAAERRDAMLGTGGRGAAAGRQQQANHDIGEEYQRRLLLASALKEKVVAESARDGLHHELRCLRDELKASTAEAKASQRLIGLQDYRLEEMMVEAAGLRSQLKAYTPLGTAGEISSALFEAEETQRRLDAASAEVALLKQQLKAALVGPAAGQQVAPAPAAAAAQEEAGSQEHQQRLAPVDESSYTRRLEQMVLNLQRESLCRQAEEAEAAAAADCRLRQVTPSDAGPAAADRNAVEVALALSARPHLARDPASDCLDCVFLFPSRLMVPDHSDCGLLDYTWVLQNRDAFMHAVVSDVSAAVGCAPRHLIEVSAFFGGVLLEKRTEEDLKQQQQQQQQQQQLTATGRVLAADDIEVHLRLHASLDGRSFTAAGMSGLLTSPPGANSDVFAFPAVSHAVHGGGVVHTGGCEGSSPESSASAGALSASGGCGRLTGTLVRQRLVAPGLLTAMREREAAVKMQKVFRGHSQRCVAAKERRRQRERHEQDASVTIQTAARGRSTRQQLKQLDKQTD